MTQLFMFIDNTAYKLLPIEPADRETTRAWRLTKKDGTEYTAHANGHGPQCTCPDFIYRHQNTESGCKHLAALQEMRLL